MGLRDRLRAHREDIRTIIELAEAFTCVATPGAAVMLVWAQGGGSFWVAVGSASVATATSFRLWVKRSPLTRRLGVEHTSMDIPETHQ